MFSLLVASCASVSAIPPGYSGPVATVQETAIRVDSGKAKMFYLEKLTEHICEITVHQSLFARHMGMEIT